MGQHLTSEQRRAVFLASLGGALEFYDFIIYAIFAKSLQQNFFPTQDKYAGLLGVFAIFAIGYLIRPLGGLIFGHFGDSIGRKKVFSYTVFLMALPTFLIGLLPTWHQIGFGASLLLVLLRLLQGLALGGEIPGSITFISEYVSFEKRAFVCGLVFCGINLGLVLGSAVADLLHFALPDNDFYQWGWRIAFWLGGVLGIISFELRKQLQETPVFTTYLELQKKRQAPILNFMQGAHLIALMQGFLLAAFGATIVGVVYLFMPTYGSTFLHYPVDVIARLNTENTLLFAVMNAVGAYLSLKVGKQILLYVSAGSLLLFALPLYMLMQHGHLALAMGLLSIFTGIYVGNYPARIAGIFETGFRYTGYAIAYNIGFALFGGLAPLVATMLIHNSQNILAPAYYLMAISVVALVAIYFSGKREAMIK